MSTEAFRFLSGSALKIYCVLRTKTYGTLPAACDWDISLPYSIIIKDTGLSNQTVRNGVVELENLGFIDLIEQGGLKSFGKTCNIYRLSMRFQDYGTPKFKSGIMKKYPGSKPGCGFSKMHEKRKATIETRAACSNIHSGNRLSSHFATIKTIPVEG
jgi:hypothetical protein